MQKPQQNTVRRLAEDSLRHCLFLKTRHYEEMLTQQKRLHKTGKNQSEANVNTYKKWQLNVKVCEYYNTCDCLV